MFKILKSLSLDIIQKITYVGDVQYDAYLILTKEKKIASFCTLKNVDAFLFITKLNFYGQNILDFLNMALFLASGKLLQNCTF